MCELYDVWWCFFIMLFLSLHGRNVSPAQVEALSQRLSVKDDQFNQLDMENQALSEDLGNVSSKLSEVQLQLQKQQQQHEFE